jgi:HSP20 family protein
MAFGSQFPRDLFAEFDRLQRGLSQAFDLSPSIRGLPRGYPAMNVGGTPKSVEIYAFCPGVDPKTLDIQIEKGLLTLSGERKANPVPKDATVHIDERFAGKFRRVVTLPQDADASKVDAEYKNGVLHIKVARQEAAQPRQITVQ